MFGALQLPWNERDAISPNTAETSWSVQGLADFSCRRGHQLLACDCSHRHAGRNDLSLRWGEVHRAIARIWNLVRNTARLSADRRNRNTVAAGSLSDERLCILQD